MIAVCFRPVSYTHLDVYKRQPSDRGKDAGDHRQSMKYYRQRMKSVYKMDRKDTVCTAEWCVTAPHDLPKQEQKAFFESVYEFMNSKYGEKNCIQCITHFDEGVKNGKGEVIAGSPHMHYTFLATKEVDNQKEYAEKLELIQEKYKEDPRGCLLYTSRCVKETAAGTAEYLL